MIFKVKRHEPRKFNYTPRYYDKKKEDMEHEKIRRGEDSNIEFRERLHVNLQEKRKMKQKSNTRILVWVALLILLLYFMFF